MAAEFSLEVQGYNDTEKAVIGVSTKPTLYKDKLRDRRIYWEK